MNLWDFEESNIFSQNWTLILSLFVYMFLGIIFCKTSYIFIRNCSPRFYIYAQMCEILYMNIFEIPTNFEQIFSKTYNEFKNEIMDLN